jgi:hypothetical protein
VGRSSCISNPAEPIQSLFFHFALLTQLCIGVSYRSLVPSWLQAFITQGLQRNLGPLVLCLGHIGYPVTAPCISNHKLLPWIARPIPLRPPRVQCQTGTPLPLMRNLAVILPRRHQNLRGEPPGRWQISCKKRKST